MEHGNGGDAGGDQRGRPRGAGQPPGREPKHAEGDREPDAGLGDGGGLFAGEERKVDRCPGQETEREYQLHDPESGTGVGGADRREVTRVMSAGEQIGDRDTQVRGRARLRADGRCRPRRVPALSRCRAWSGLAFRLAHIPARIRRRARALAPVLYRCGVVRPVRAAGPAFARRE